MCFVFNAPRCCSQTSNSVSVFFCRWELGISLDLRHAQKRTHWKDVSKTACWLLVILCKATRIWGFLVGSNMTQPHHGYSPCTVPLICFFGGTILDLIVCWGKNPHGLRKWWKKIWINRIHLIFLSWMACSPFWRGIIQQDLRVKQRFFSHSELQGTCTKTHG